MTNIYLPGKKLSLVRVRESTPARNRHGPVNAYTARAFVHEPITADRGPPLSATAFAVIADDENTFGRDFITRVD